MTEITDKIRNLDQLLNQSKAKEDEDTKSPSKNV
jgi:hypothetical protein